MGRFGVGFAAVLAVSDEPAVLSRTGGVRFSREDTAALVAAAGVRTPPRWPPRCAAATATCRCCGCPSRPQGEPPDGFDTAVVLPLRDEVAADAVRAQLDARWTTRCCSRCPRWREVVLDVDGRRRVLTGADRALARAPRGRGAGRRPSGPSCWPTAPPRSGASAGWQVLWAVPRDRGASRVPARCTPRRPPTSRCRCLRCCWPRCPLDPTRRHVAPGPADRPAGRPSARAATRTCSPSWPPPARVRRSRRPAAGAGRPARRGAGRSAARAGAAAAARGRDPARRRGRSRRCARGTPSCWTSTPTRPRSPRWRRGWPVWSPHPSWARAALRALGVAGAAARRRGGNPAGARAIRRPGASCTRGWRRSRWTPTRARRWRALPVPLADGRVVRGARGLLLGEPGQLPARALQALAPFGLRVVHPGCRAPAAGAARRAAGVGPGGAGRPGRPVGCRAARRGRRAGGRRYAEATPGGGRRGARLVAAAVAAQGLVSQVRCPGCASCRCPTRRAS